MKFLFWFLSICIWKGDAFIIQPEFFYQNGSLIPDVSELYNKQGAIHFIPYVFWNSSNTPAKNMTVYYKHTCYNNKAEPLYFFNFNASFNIALLENDDEFPVDSDETKIYCKISYWDNNLLRIYQSRRGAITNNGLSSYIPFLQFNPQGQSNLFENVTVYYQVQYISKASNQMINEACGVQTMKTHEWLIPYNIFTYNYQIDSIKTLNMYQYVSGGVPRVIFNMIPYLNSTTNPIVYKPASQTANTNTFYYETILYQFDGIIFHRVSAAKQPPGATFNTFDDLETNPLLLTKGVYVYETVYFNLNGERIYDTTPLKATRSIILKPLITYYFPNTTTTSELNYTMIDTPRSKGVDLAQNLFEPLTIYPQASIELMYGDQMDQVVPPTESPTPCVVYFPATTPTPAPWRPLIRNPTSYKFGDMIKSWIDTVFNLNSALQYRRKIDEGLM